MQSFKSFSGQYHVWLIHHNGQSHWDSHSDFGKAKADAIFAAHEHNCKAIIMHDNFKHVAVVLPDGKMRTHLHEDLLDEAKKSRLDPNVSYKQREIHSILKEYGWQIRPNTGASSNHDVFHHPESPEKIAVPRGSSGDVNRALSSRIIKTIKKYVRPND